MGIQTCTFTLNGVLVRGCGLALLTSQRFGVADRYGCNWDGWHLHNG